jgi:predicted nuclease of predicted toxin-antitoxin system
MNGFLLDENIPSQLRFNPGFPVFGISAVGITPTDTAIWEFARKRNLAIVTKDADFSERITAGSSPPWIVHIRFGNVRKAEFHELLARAWPRIVTLLKTHKLVNVYADRIEGFH